MDATNRSDVDMSKSNKHTEDKQDKPDPLAALQFMREKMAVRNVDVRRMTTMWQARTDGRLEDMGSSWTFKPEKPTSKATIQTSSFEEAVLSLALEAAFPQSAIIQLTDRQLKWNFDMISSMQNGSACGGFLTAGSRAEGLAIENGWGHPEPDEDTMLLIGGPVTVHVPQVGNHAPEDVALVYRSEGCPPAYCKIEIRDPQPLMEVEVAGARRLDAGCIHNSNGVDWLHINYTLRRLHPGNRPISGPAGQHGLDEYIPALLCSTAHPDMELEYMRRSRSSWPSPEQLQYMRQLPMLLVLVGHKRSAEFDLQARLSWSHYEIWLLIKLSNNIKQVYIAVKYVFKYIMKELRGADGDDGRSHVGSYHLKTVFMRYLEKRTPTMIGSQSKMMSDILHDLDDYLVAGELPHYFLPDCDLLATVRPGERHIARNAIQRILSDPLCAILTSPLCSREIYGEVRPDALVTALHQVLARPDYMGSHEDLRRLLIHLYEGRELKYQQRHEKDIGQFRVSGRTKPTKLVDVLNKIYR